MQVIAIVMILLAGSADIKPPPAALGLDTFYKKCILVQGIPIVGSHRVDDRALQAAEEIVRIMLKKRKDLASPMIARKLRIAIMAPTEQTLDIPEHSDLQRAFPDTDWNKRARGLGATVQRPCVSGAEENLLGLPGDRYRGESILIHEFGHTVLNFGLESLDKTFRNRLQAAFKESKKTGVWRNTYAASNLDEYWAEGVQSWFDANQKGPVGGNGVHNEIWNREALLTNDKLLHDLLSEAFVSDWKWKAPTAKSDRSK